MKLTKEDIDKVRHIEGFPIAKDEDIIALSNPPYYTACPNPFIEDFIKEHGKPYDEATDDYHREPFAADVSEGKNDPIYNAHSYHTKVPYKAIMRYILHYTNPGDIVFDGFCGTGMTGIAAQMCGCPDPEFKRKIEQEMPYIKWGTRKAVLNDLSPAATNIAYNYNTNMNLTKFKKEMHCILQSCENELGWMYQTQHVDLNGKPIIGVDGSPVMGRINYTVWSDVFICPNCSSDIIYWDVAYDKTTNKIKDKFKCNKCGLILNKRDCMHATEKYYDNYINDTVLRNKQVPTMINYSVGNKRFNKTPDDFDLQTIEKVHYKFVGLSNDNMRVYPMMFIGGKDWGELCCPGYHLGITHVHHFYSERNYVMLHYLWNGLQDYHSKWAITAVLNYICKKQSFTGGGGGMPGVLAIASLVQEKNVIDVVSRKVDSITKAFSKSLNNNGMAVIISTGSANDLPNIPDNSIDYIFIDPPFGRNIIYSEANFLHEALLNVFTNNKSEAIICRHQGKSLSEYQKLFTDCITEFAKKLKGNRWMTIEFHNSKNSIWNAIQEAIMRAGLIIGDVRTLDKEQGSFKQVKEKGAVKQDLVISAYKPKESFKREFVSHAGSEETAWSFVRQHLEKLPVVVVKNGKIELIAERQAFLLYDRMVAYHIMNGIAVPLDATDFYKGLDERFLKRDGMYFLADQVNEYDTARIINDVEPIQFELFVTNEKSAIAWLYQQLETPQTYAELQPKFMQEIKAWDKYEARPELAVLLEENFLQDDKGRWYIPDITKSADVAKLREKKLLKEFEGYLATKGKLKLFRTEAIRVGFAKLWADKNYKLIVETAERLPESVIQEDDKLLMYYDLSLGRI